MRRTRLRRLPEEDVRHLIATLGDELGRPTIVIDLFPGRRASGKQVFACSHTASMGDVKLKWEPDEQQRIRLDGSDAPTMECALQVWAGGETMSGPFTFASNGQVQEISYRSADLVSLKIAACEVLLDASEHRGTTGSWLARHPRTRDALRHVAERNLRHKIVHAPSDAQGLHQLLGSCAEEKRSA